MSVKRMIASHTKMALHDRRIGMQVIRRALEHDMSIVEYIHQIGKFNIAKMVRKEIHHKPEWNTNSGYMQLAMCADAVERTKTFYPPGVTKGTKQSSTSNPRSEMYCSVRRTIDWFGQPLSRGARRRPTWRIPMIPVKSSGLRPANR
jgi:hypothetical protein